MSTISGVMVLRNAVKLQYPFEPALRSLRALCDEVVVLVDPTSEDGHFIRHVKSSARHAARNAYYETLKGDSIDFRDEIKDQSS